jgi:hypothetical protein
MRRTKWNGAAAFRGEGLLPSIERRRLIGVPRRAIEKTTNANQAGV